MINSIEAAVLHSVLEGHEERAAERLHEHFLDRELHSFRNEVATLLALVDLEIKARRSTLAPAADTGEINIIRGRE